MIKGFVLYHGPSRIDGKPIVVIATLRTENAKTGPMIQTWIMRADVNPVKAINTGDDASVCGQCKHRGIIADGRNRQRSCYVSVRNAPRAVWQAWRDGRYVTYCHAEHKQHFAGKAIRLGSYGDPAAVPMRVFLPILRVCSGHSGYTHQWMYPKFARWAQYVMASTDTADEMACAQSAGWRTFRTRLESEAVAKTEIVCPASEEGGLRRDCASCLACSGGSPEKRSIAIIAHGSPSTLASYERTRFSLPVLGGKV